MTDKKILIKEFIGKNPSLNATQTLKGLQKEGFKMRKTDFLKEFREIKKLPEPSLAKREKSIPVKHRTTTQKKRIKARVKPKISKPKPKPKPKPTKQLKLPVKVKFKDTKFGQIAKDIQDKHGISEKKAIIRARTLLKIPRKDFGKLNKKDKDILVQYGY